MPSDQILDDRMAEALAALAPARESYRSALIATAEEVRGLLATRGATAEARAARTAAELGTFAVGHIDIDRFASLQAAGESIADEEAPRLEAASRTLEALVERGDALHLARLEPGADLRDAVIEALGRAGSAFGAARTVELARAGRYDPAEHEAWLESFPPDRWNRRERELAPPLVVELDGADMRPAGLADVLDGSQKLVLVVRGDSPPAPLARLITPGVLVLQTDEPAQLSVAADASGPAVAALVPAGACRFVHQPDPETGRGRLVVSHMSEGKPKRTLGRISAFQQAEELHLLESLAGAWSGAAPEAAPSRDGGAPVAAADRLAAWILRQSGASGTG